VTSRLSLCVGRAKRCQLSGGEGRQYVTLFTQKQERQERK
jgi:hypothetical protein